MWVRVRVRVRVRVGVRVQVRVRVAVRVRAGVRAARQDLLLRGSGALRVTGCETTMMLRATRNSLWNRVYPTHIYNPNPSMPLPRTLVYPRNRVYRTGYW